MSHEPRDETEVPAPEAGQATQENAQGKVIELRRIVDNSPPDTPVVEKLEQALRAARAGEFRSVIVIGLTAHPDGLRVMWSSGASDLEKVGALDVAREQITNLFGVGR